MQEFLIHFDSRKRDKLLYPTSTTFFVSFPKNVQYALPGSLPATASLIACEMANVANSISAETCSVTWQHLNVSSPVYNAKINTGTYTLTTLCNELLRVLNTAQRLPNDPIFDLDPDNARFNQQHHWALVYASSPDSGLTLASLYRTQKGLPSDVALQVFVNDINMICTKAGHGLNVNDIISIQGVTKQVGGLPAMAYINTTFQVITVIDADHFTVQLSQAAYEDYSVGLTGEPNLTFGIPLSFKFLSSTTLLPVIGFPRQSGDVVGHLDDFAACIKDWYNKDPTSNNALINLPWLPDRFCSIGTTVMFDQADVIGIKSTSRFICVNTTQKTFYVDLDELRNAVKFILANEPLGFTAEQSARLIVLTDTGYKRAQSNILTTGALYSSVNLSGATHCFVLSPQCRTSLNDNGTLAKIQMVSASGYLNFNNVVGQETQLLNHKGRSRGGLLLQFTDESMKNSIYNYGLEISGTLKIKAGVERYDMPEQPF